MSEAPDYLEVLACFIGECPSDIRTYSLRAVTPSARCGPLHPARWVRWRVT